MDTQSTSMNRKMMKSQFSKSLAFFQEMRLPISVNLPILQILKCLLFFSYLLVQEKHVQKEILRKKVFVGNFGVKSHDFGFSLPKKNSKSYQRRNSVVKFFSEGQSHGNRIILKLNIF